MNLSPLEFSVIRTALLAGLAAACTLATASDADAQFLRCRRAKSVGPAPIVYTSSYQSYNPCCGVPMMPDAITYPPMMALDGCGIYVPPIVNNDQPPVDPNKTNPTATEPTPEEMKQWAEMVKGGVFEEAQLPSYKAATTAERKKFYDDFKKAAPAAPTEVSPEELKQWEEMVKAGSFEQAQFETYKTLSKEERKTAYDTYKKAAKP